MTGRQTQFSRNLQGTAQDLQRIQQVISSLTDTIRGVSREFSSLLSGANQASSQQGGQAPIPGLGMGMSQMGSSLLANAQQKLAEDVARYQREAESRQTMTQEQAKADQTLRILENNARRHGQGRPDLSLIQTTHPNIFQDAIAGRIGAQANPAEAIAKAMQDRLREGMSVPEASLLLKKTLPQEQLESFSRYSGSFGEYGRRMSGIQRMVGLPEEQVRSHVSQNEEKARFRTEETERKQAEQRLEAQRMQAHSSLTAGFSAQDRTRAIQLAAQTGDSSLMMSLGDVQRVRSQNVDDMVAQAERQSDKLRESASGLDRAASQELQEVVKEIKALRASTEKADQNLLTAMTQEGIKPGDPEYEKLLREVRQSADKQAQAVERLGDLTRGGGGGPGGDTPSFFQRNRRLLAGIGGLAATGVATGLAIGSLSDTALSSNIGANRRAMTSLAGIEQINAQRYFESADMRDPRNLLKYQGDMLLPDYLRGQYTGTGNEASALAEAMRENLQALEVGHQQFRRTPWRMGADAAQKIGVGMAGGFAVGGPAGMAVGGGAGFLTSLGSGANIVSGLEGNIYAGMQGGIPGITPQLAADYLTNNRADLYSREKIRETSMSLGLARMRSREELRDSEVQTNQRQLHSFGMMQSSVEAEIRGARLVGRRRAISGVDVLAQTPEYEEYQGRVEEAEQRRKDSLVKLGEAITAEDQSRSHLQNIDNVWRASRELGALGVGRFISPRHRAAIRRAEEMFGDKTPGASYRKMRSEALESLNERVAATKESEESVAESARNYQEQLNSLSVVTEATKRGMTKVEFADVANRLALMDAPGTGDISKQERLLRTGRMLDISIPGIMTQDDFMSNVARMQTIRGGTDAQQGLESALARAVATGFDNARTSQMFVGAVQDLSDSLRITHTDTVQDRLAIGASMLGAEFGTADARSLRMASEGLGQWASATGARTGIMGQTKLYSALEAGFDLVTGGIVAGKSEPEMEAWLDQLRTGEITDPGLRRMLTQYDEDELYKMLGGVVDATHTAFGSIVGISGVDTQRGVENILRMKKHEDETEEEFKTRQSKKLDNLLLYTGGTADWFGYGEGGGHAGAISIMERTARREGLEIPGFVSREKAKKNLEDHTRENYLIDAALQNHLMAGDALDAATMAELKKTGFEDIAKALEKGNIVLKGGGAALSEEEVRGWADKPPDLERLREIQRDLPNILDVTRGTFLQQGRDVMSPSYEPADVSEVGKTLKDSVGTFSSKVDAFSAKIEEATRRIDAHLAILREQ